MSHAERLLPLTHLTYHVLLVMADRPLHGYAILQEVERRTEGAMQVEAGTLYAALKRMVDEKLIVPADDGAGSRRRTYRLTGFGREVLEVESRRLQQLVAVARDKRVLPQEGH